MTKSRTSFRRGGNSFSLLFFFLILVLAFTAVPAQAVTFTVDSETDAVDDDIGDGDCETAALECTLRAAIQEANNLVSDDIIMLSEGTYALSIPGTGEGAAATGDLDITDTTGTLTIIGDNAGSIIDGAGLDTVIEVQASTTVTISKVTITGGAFDEAGGIYNNGTLTLTESTITSNTAIDPTFAYGGGIYNDTSGSITLTNVTISGNTATTDGGGIYNDGTMQITNVTIAENDATTGAGGGIYTTGTTTLKNTIISDNTASGADENCAGAGTLTSNGYNISSDATCNLELGYFSLR